MVQMGYDQPVYDSDGTLKTYKHQISSSTRMQLPRLGWERWQWVPDSKLQAVKK